MAGGIPACGASARIPIGRQRGECGSDRPESQPVVEPERAGLEAFAVAAAELRGFGNEMVDAEALAVDAQHLAEQVRRFAAAIRREDVDADLRRAEKRPAAAIADRHRILEQHEAHVRIERQAAARSHRVQRDRHAAPQRVVLDAFRFRRGNRVGFATQARQHGATRVEQVRALRARERARRREWQGDRAPAGPRCAAGRRDER